MNMCALNNVVMFVFRMFVLLIFVLTITPGTLMAQNKRVKVRAQAKHQTYQDYLGAIIDENIVREQTGLSALPMLSQQEWEESKGIIPEYSTDNIDALSHVTRHKASNKSGFASFNHFGVGIGIGDDKISDIAVGFHTINGVMINGNGFVGAGVGYNMSMDDYGLNEIPVYFHGRAFMGNTTAKPYIFGDLGYSFYKMKSIDDYQSASMKIDPGLTFGGGLGVFMAQESAISIFCDAGFRISKGKISDSFSWSYSTPVWNGYYYDYVYTTYYYSYTYKFSAKQISINVGVAF